MSAENGWANRERGNEVEKKCDMCGRSLYVSTKSTDLLCDGCGDAEPMCLCPDSREMVGA